MTGTIQGSPIEAAKAAFSRHAWREAYERFGDADAAGRLGPEDLISYAEAAWWTGETDDAIRMRERAYAMYLEDEQKQTAAKVAMFLADEQANRRAYTVAEAWLARAARLLEGDTESAAYAELVLRRARQALETGKPDEAISLARVALALGEKHGDRDVQAMGLTAVGLSLVSRGEVREGLKYIDEATMAAVSGELSLFVTGVVYCNTISTCRDIGDVRRASDWTEAAHRWCDRQSVGGFPGVCRVHRAEVIALRGALAKAEQEARLACDELMKWDIQYIAGEGFYEIGSIRLRMGDLPAAEEAFRHAHELGRSPEPGLALIRLAEGKAAAANASLTRALEDEHARPGRARLLPAQVEVAIAAGDLETARAACEELDQIATSFGTVALRASAHQTRGACVLAAGDAAGARRHLQDAVEAWQQLDAPYEVARARMLLGQAARALGDEDGARLELSAAKATLERIGARRDARIAAELLGDAGAAPVEPRVTRTFLFSDIVSSTQLIGIIGDDAWRDLIRWHDDTLRSIVAEHAGEEIRHQGDGLVVAFDSPARALECAIAIQRRLADHRRTHGFAPTVRIGVHETEATQRGLDYAGVGVHEAARVGALARGGEILATRATLAASGRPFTTGDARRVELKGIAEPVEVVAVDWR